MNTLLATALLAKLLATPSAEYANPVPRYATLQNGGIACVLESQADLRRAAGGRNPKALHFIMCLDGHDGSVVGAMVRRNGTAFCNVNGVVDPNTLCAVMNGCGLYNQTVCG